MGITSCAGFCNRGRSISEMPTIRPDGFRIRRFPGERTGTPHVKIQCLSLLQSGRLGAEIAESFGLTNGNLVYKIQELLKGLRNSHI